MKTDDRILQRARARAPTLAVKSVFFCALAGGLAWQPYAALAQSAPLPLIRITPMGKVGTYGVLDPQVQLHVLGDIFFTGCLKNTSTGAIVSGTCGQGIPPPSAAPVVPFPTQVPPPMAPFPKVAPDVFKLPDFSDQRFKQNIQPLPDLLPAFAALQVHEYVYQREQFPARELPAGRQTGVLAQDLRRLLPELVTQDREGYLSVDYAALNRSLLQAASELAVRNAEKTRELAGLKARIADISAALKNQQRELAALRSHMQLSAR